MKIVSLKRLGEIEAFTYKQLPGFRILFFKKAVDIPTELKMN